MLNLGTRLFSIKMAKIFMPSIPLCTKIIFFDSLSVCQKKRFGVEGWFNERLSSKLVVRVELLNPLEINNFGQAAWQLLIKGLIITI